MKKEQLIDYKSSILAVANAIVDFGLTNYLKEADSPTDIPKMIDKYLSYIAENNRGFIKGTRFYDFVRGYILSLVYIDTKLDRDGVTYCIGAPIAHNDSQNNKVLYSCYITRRIDKMTHDTDGVIIAPIMGFKNNGVGKVLTAEKMYLYDISKYNLDTLYLAIKNTIRSTIENKIHMISRLIYLIWIKQSLI